MTTISFDVEFMQKHVKERGLVLMEAAVLKDPALLLSILDSGWGDATCREAPHVGRRFLTHLVHVGSPKTATQALRLYFRGADPEAVTNHVVASAAKDGIASPLISWMESRANRAVVKALVTGAKELGADFDLLFTHSNHDPTDGKSKSADHTVLSVLLTCGYRVNETELPEHRKDQVRDILAWGKDFDKCTAGHISKMPPGVAASWIKLFVDEGVAKPSELVQMTSRMKVVPETKALLASMAAIEAIDGLLGERGPAALAP